MRSCDCSREALRARLSGQQWRLIEDGRAPGAWNMAADEAMLELARRSEAPPTLRLYGWSRPTLSLGRHQDPRAGIDHDFRGRRGIDLVRRPTGGRAVLHDREVTYSITLPASLARGAGVGEVYSVLSGALLAGLTQAFRRSGVQAFRCSGVQAFRCSGVQPFGGDKDGPAFDFAGPERPNARTPERLITDSAATCRSGSPGSHPPYSPPRARTMAAGG